MKILKPAPIKSISIHTEGGVGGFGGVSDIHNEACCLLVPLTLVCSFLSGPADTFTGPFCPGAEGHPAKA